MFKVLRQYLYSLLVVLFLFNLIGCDEAELQNPEGIGVYALKNLTKRQLFYRNGADSIFIDTSATQVINVFNEPNGPALPEIGLPAILEIYYHDTPVVNLVAIQIETKKMEWFPTKYDKFEFGHVQYLSFLNSTMLKK